MKKINTTVRTGSEILYNNNRCLIGTITNNKIKFTTFINSTSAYSEYISTRELNKRLAISNIITL